MENRVLAAAGLVCLGCLIIGFTDNYVRVIAAEAGIWQFHLIRSLMALPIMALVARMMGQGLWPRRVRPVLLRSLFAASSMFIYFGCLALMPIGEVVAGLYTAPIFVLLISALVYGERIGPWRIFGVILGFAGILIILRVDQVALSPLSLMPVLAGFLYAIGNIGTRRWCAGEGALTLNAGFFLFMGIGGAIGAMVLGILPVAAPDGPEGFVLRGWVMPSATFFFWTFVQAVGSLVGVALVIRGYQIAEASYVAVFENALLVFAVFWALVLWGEVPSLSALIGMAAIAGAGTLIALRRDRPGAAISDQAARAGANRL
ncbi:DMT family transporter [Halodurantibacterium flavum]|uniref:DMT family transporter n=1 Tax=Halodurantibacterium flavum TaxID=1382802 RepID=A0ABW4S172_9RHOB